MKVVGYLRCSTRRQELEGQRRAITEWASRSGHYLANLYEDDATSGRTTARAGIDTLLEHLEKTRDVELVAVTELSRIGRSLSFIHSTVERLSAHGVKIVLVHTGAILDARTLEGKALLGALALAAEVEWHLIQEQNARGRETIRARGVRVGRKPADLSETALLALREKGLSVREIAAELRVSPATIGRRLQALARRGDTGPEPPPPAA